MHPYLIPPLLSSAQFFLYFVKKHPKELFDTPTHPGRFTPREVLAHMADFEPIFLERMILALNASGTEVMSIDEEQRVIDQGYSEWDPLETAKLFASRRSEAVSWLRTLSGDQWNQTIIHSELGAMSIYDQANMLLGHDLYHIEQLTDVLSKK